MEDFFIWLAVAALWLSRLVGLGCIVYIATYSPRVAYVFLLVYVMAILESELN